MDKWDLSVLFKSEEECKEAANDLKKICSDFENKWRNKIAALADELAISKDVIESSGIENGAKNKLKDAISSKLKIIDLIAEYEKCCEKIGAVGSYAGLYFAADTRKGAFYGECELALNSANEHLLFLESEFSEAPSAVRECLCELGGKYKYFLENLNKSAKYQLSLKEEKVLLKTDPVGKSAFSRLFSEHLARLKFDFLGQKVGEEELLSKLYDKDRQVRKTAAQSLSDGLKEQSELLAFIFNIVRKNLKIKAELRGYESLEESRHISNQITQKSVDSMVCAINKKVDLVAKYYHKKREILGLDKLYDYDRYAPIESSDDKMDYESSKSLVLSCFADFCPDFAKIAERAFKEGWVDSHPRDFKQNGAFSHSAVPNAHPFLMLNHTDRRRDAFTMAHELGHTIHQFLSNSVGYLNSDTPLTTAETASVFAEMLLFERMKKSLPKNELIALYAGKLEDIFATLFRQNVFTNFERAVHSKPGELSVAEFSEIWQSENQKMFGDSVELSENYALWWSYIPHFIHTPFYCYAYSYGQLLVLALFGLYKREGASFVPKYLEFLSSGGSRAPHELVGLFGFDIESADFWEIGLGEVERLLGEFLDLAK